MVRASTILGSDLRRRRPLLVLALCPILWTLSWVGGVARGEDVALPSRVVKIDAVEKSGALDDGRRFHVVAERRPFRGDADPLAQVPFLSGDGAPPRFVLEKLAITVGGAEIALPSTAWTDLSDPDLSGGVRLTQGDGSLVVHVLGGDGAGSYRASLLIRGARLVARRVEQHDGEARMERFWR